jgi:dihydrofolate synthase/folylpolyglutamate synthase
MTVAQQEQLAQWVERIVGYHADAIALGLDRINQIYQPNDCFHLRCPVLLVAGTNGKGSCVKTLESIYHAAGYRVGAYYSPHLFHFTERASLNQQPATPAQWIAAFEIVDRLRGGIPLTFFEFTTLAALALFNDAGLDVVILEVGMGGRLDAVNVVTPALSIVTQVGWDHQAYLGDTLAAIAYEKAGIYRAGKPCLFADLNPPAALTAHIEAIGGIPYYYQRDYTLTEATTGQEHNAVFSTPQGLLYKDLRLPALPHQSVAAAVMASHLLQAQLPVSDQALAKGLAASQLRGRCEHLVLGQTHWLCDVGHNANAAQWLAEQVARHLDHQKEVIAIIGVLSDKSLEALIAPLSAVVTRWIAVDLPTERAYAATDMAAVLHAAAALVTTAVSPQAATKALMAEKDGQKLVIAYGSFYTVAGVLPVLDAWRGTVES